MDGRMDGLMEIDGDGWGQMTNQDGWGQVIDGDGCGWNRMDGDGEGWMDEA